MKEKNYNRENAVKYAMEWAYKRNPKYFDFENFGGDCTSFVSQCVYAGSKVMNYTPVFGWFYNSAYDRSPSWSGVEYLYNFLTQNKGVGPYGTETEISNVQIGDVIQLGNKNSEFYHSLIITKIVDFPRVESIYVSAHSYDANLRRLNSYIYSDIRFIHINGVRYY